MITVYLRDGDYLELKNLKEENGWVHGEYEDGEGRVHIPDNSILYIEEAGEDEGLVISKPGVD